jgi:hypothetical protein
VGGRAFNTWEQIPEGFLEFCRNQIPEHRRPSAKNQEMIGRIIAQNIPELPNGKVFGDCDETHAQIAARAHGRVSMGEVASALKSLDGNVFLITRKPAKGRSGTHRVIHPELTLKIATWERSGAEPTPQEVTLWDERLYGLGYRPQHSGIEAQRSGVSPVPPIEVPITSTYKKPKSVGSSKKDDEIQNPLTKIQQLEAKLSYLEDAQRDLSDPFKAQQARFRYIETLANIRQLRSD